MPRQDILIAIDGPAGSGKSTTARLLARALGVPHLNTGALYRAVTWALLKRGIWPGEPERISEVLDALRLELRPAPEGFRIWVDGQDVTDALYQPEVAAHASEVSALPEVRAWLLDRQRALGEAGGLVVEGRDIGTVVFPDADLKVFLVADLRERARRRWQELHSQGVEISPEQVEAELRKRDERDAMRPIAPLRPAADARILDTTALSVEEQVACILQWAREIRRIRYGIAEISEAK